MTGFLITFEGGEGAGKTTLIEEIARQLTAEGHQIIKTREPGGTKMAEEIRALLLNHSTEKVSSYTELCLFLAARAQHIAEVIGPALKNGKIVLCDRFNDSTIAYQGAARGLGMEQVADFCAFISQGLNPQLTLYLDIDPEIGLMRAKRARAQDRIESETIAFHSKIREAFHSLHRAHPKRLHLIDASQSVERVFSDAMYFVHTLLSKQNV